ncbi:hypothetical protein FRB95_014536 [Tulasnella sp. JGI-2019a]|nr:hypothetical protein FRB95_014536 [Tulasnella sp. JGI-2019a]
MNRMSLEIPFTSKPIRLHHLSVQACSIPWDSCLFSELKTLELHRLEKKGPSLDQFIDFLHASPDLVRLTLWEWNLQGTIVTNYSDIITLQSLETFEMSDITCHVAEHLLAILRIPVCTRFRLINDNHSDCKLFSLSMEHLFPTLRAIMASCGDTEVTLHKLGLTVTSCKRRKRILIIKLSTGAAPPDWQTVMSERLRNLLGSTTAIPALHLQISTNIEEFLPTVSPLVGSSCTIEELILTQEGPDPTISDKLGRVLALLSKPREVDGVTRWPLPNLRSLIIQHDTWMEKEPLFNMVRNRYADHEPGHERPAKLQSLRIESGSKGSDKGFPPMMRSILGPRVVKYGSRKPTTRYYED